MQEKIHHIFTFHVDAFGQLNMVWMTPPPARYATGQQNIPYPLTITNSPSACI